MDFLNQLATLIVTVRRNMLSSIMTTLLILVLIIAWSARGNISTFLQQNPSAQQKTERVQRSIASDKKISTVLQADLSALNADRVSIRQFINQVDTASTTGVVPSILTPYVVMAPGVMPPSDAITPVLPVPRTYLSDILIPMWKDPYHPVCVDLLVDNVRDTVYHAKLVSDGVAESFFCPIVDIDGAPIGFIGASYLTMTKSHPPVDKVFMKLSLTATKVAGYIAEVITPEQQVWYRKLLSL